MAVKESGVPLSGLCVRPPLPQPRNIVCLAVNYLENGMRKEPAPLNAFHKSPNACEMHKFDRQAMR